MYKSHINDYKILKKIMKFSADIEDGENFEFSCRICLEEGNRKDFIAPCECRGSSRWVHRECLDKWRSINEDRFFSSCQTCLGKYKLVSLVDDSNWQRTIRKLNFTYFVVRDIGSVILLTQVIIGLIALFTFSLDTKDHALAETFNMDDHIKSFYYLFGLSVCLAVVGIGD